MLAGNSKRIYKAIANIMLDNYAWRFAHAEEPDGEDAEKWDSSLAEEFCPITVADGENGERVQIFYGGVKYNDGRE
jgi:hypothetical protein